MARLSRFLFGGVVGAGLALILSPKSGKEIRSLISSGGRKQLSAGGEDYRAPSDFATPDTSVREPAAGVSLESRIEETRQQVAQEFDGNLVSAPEASPYAAAEEPEAEAPIFVSEPPAQVDVEEQPDEMIEETPAEMEIQELPDEMIEETPAEAEIPVQPATGESLLKAQKEAASREWETLMKPAEGEPSLEADLNADTTADLNEMDRPAESTPAPAGIDRDEMRKRIDETRARLKAKAFDAMISGETFVESENPALRRENTPEPGVDQKTADQIDDSLREED
ncbi:MAG: YtxH domain-containing protein [Thermoleophilia bacterium]